MAKLIPILPSPQGEGLITRLSRGSVAERTEADTRDLTKTLKRVLARSPNAKPGQPTRIANKLLFDALGARPLPINLRQAFARCASDLVTREMDLFAMPPLPGTNDAIAAAQTRAVLRQRLDFFARENELVSEWITRLSTILTALGTAIPILPTASSGMVIPVPILALIDDPAAFISRLITDVLPLAPSPGSIDVRPGQYLARTIVNNLLAVSKLSLEDAQKRPDRLRWPEAGKQTSEELVKTYLAGTPFAELFAVTMPLPVPDAVRFEHHWIVAGSGHGKTQTLQYLIAQDIEKVRAGNASVIVIDSQGDLIKNISGLKDFAPGQPLSDKLCLIDPTDIEYPVALNLFDVGMERINSYAPLERERLINGILELYDFVLGSLLSAELTQKQAVIFRYIMRLMLYIPDANIQTLRELMEPDGYEKYRPHIDKLKGTARAFFDTEFNSREFTATKQQILRRLWGILENQTFERMFSHPKNKLDLFHEMNSGKVILINTAKDLLKQNGTEIFGRFFIAMIAQAAQERATLPKEKRLPCYVYVDECQDYVDQNVALILEQARKYNVGMILAHQYVGQLPAKLVESFAANTSIKFAGGVSDKDARTLCHMLRTTPEFIERQPKGSFAASVRNVTQSAVTMTCPFGHMEQLPRMSMEERDALRDIIRERYAVHHSEVEQSISEQLGDQPEYTDPDGGESDEVEEW